MSAPSKSIDKNKRYAGVKANDFVSKTRTNEASRATARTQGWANLGKINNSRRVPPPANVPSLKSETNTTTSTFDPTILTSSSHGWTAGGNQTPTNLGNTQARPSTPSKQPTQQQLDSLPAHASASSSHSQQQQQQQQQQQTSSSLSSDLDKPRQQATWSTVTAGHGSDQPPNLLGLNDFPRLATQDNKSSKPPSDSLISAISSTTTQGPSFRPANLASWKEGGGRAQPISTDSAKDANDNSNNNNYSNLSMQSQILPTNTNSNQLQSQMQNASGSSYMRMYPQQQQQQQQQQMWSYNTGNSYGAPYGNNQAPAPIPIHQLHHQQRGASYGSNNPPSQQRLNTSADYKTPTILRNKDIDDLSKITANVTWASAPQEVNYEEKIRFSDDEDTDVNDNNANHKSRRFNNSQQQSRPTYPHVLQNNNRTSHSSYSQQPTSTTTHSRLLQDDEHVKQMQDNKNSELISTLTVAKQRRDEQERSLRDTLPHRPATTIQKSFDEPKQIPGYQTRPLLAATAQENLPSAQMDPSSMWGQSKSETSTSRTRHDTADSQTFAMKSWSDQMDSFNYASLHEKSGIDADDHNNEPMVGAVSRSSAPRKYSRSQSESSSHSQTDNGSSINRSKHFPATNRKPQKSTAVPLKSASNTARSKPKPADVINYFDNNEQQPKANDQWGDWEDSSYSTNNRYQQQYMNDRRRQPQHQQQQQQQQQQQSSADLSQKSSRYSEQTNELSRTKPAGKPRSNVATRPTDLPATTASKLDNKNASNKAQQVWRALSPTRPADSNDPTPQESTVYKPEPKTSDPSDRRQSAPAERKQRYATTSTTINTSSIPSLMSVRSDILPTPVSQTNPSGTATSKHYKGSNQSQRQDYSGSSHYSQRNDFYNETNDSAWGNDDDYYEDETGYYDPNAQTHQRHHQSMGYHSQTHHRGYTTLGSYGRYRRGGALRHQQQYATYNANSISAGSSSQLNTSAGSKTKKIPPTRIAAIASKKATTELPEQFPTEVEPSNVVPDVKMTKSSAWSAEPQPATVEEIPIIKSAEASSVPPAVVTEKPTDLPGVAAEPTKYDTESAIPSQPEADATNRKAPATTAAATSQRKSTKEQSNYHQDQRYSNQQAPRHRNNYGRSTQDYESMQMSAHNYYGANRRTARGGRNTHLLDLSSGYYYEHSQPHYNSRYNYSDEHYSQQQPQTRSTNRSTKRGGSSLTSDQHPHKSKTASGSNSTSGNLHQQSVSDNELKEGEEWETASESSANMRSSQNDTNQPQVAKSTANEAKSTNRDRTPPKKSFSSQRPLSTRYNESGAHRRGYNLYERGSKTGRGLANHRANRLSTSQRQGSPQRTEGENVTAKQTAASKKDQHRHSLDGYDLNNVAGVVKIETLPAGALEEESTAFDDGGEEFCVVMSKRGRKEQKAAQLSKQNASESSTEPMIKSTSIDNDEQQVNEKSSTDDNQISSTRTRNGKSLPPRFSSKSTTRQHNAKSDHQNASMYYYDQNYYYYDQSQYYDQENSYYNYGNYNQSHRQTSTRRKQRVPQNQENNTTDEPLNERKTEANIADQPHSIPSNVMSNIQMWDPHTDSAISNPSKLIEKPMHDRKFGNEIAPPSSSNDGSLPLHQRTASALPTHSPVSKTNESIGRTIKPPVTDNKSDRDNKTKSTAYEKNDTISSLGSNQLFEKSTFLDYDDKQSIGTVGDDLNQKINSIKTIWDSSDHPSLPRRQLEQTISSMVAMQQQQQQDNGMQGISSTKADGYVSESIPTSSVNMSGANTNVSSSANDDTHNKNPPSAANLQSGGSSSGMNQSVTYSGSSGQNKNEQKNICTVKPTQQVAPNIQDQVDAGGYPNFPPPPLQQPMSQASLQQHILPQSQMNPLHQQPSYPFYESLLPPQQQPQQQQQQPPFNRMYSSNANSTSTDPINSDFSGLQSSQIYPPQNFPYRNTNVYMPPPNVPNTNSMYHHTSQGSISAPPQNNAMPPPMPSYPSPFLVDHGAHMLSQAQPPPPPQGYMNSQMMSGRPQGGPFYRTPPPQQIQAPPGPPPYGSQDPLAHGGYYTPFFPPPNSNAPPGHPTTHNLYGQNEGFHPPHPQLFTRGGSIDRGDHPLMSQSLSRQANYPSASSNQQQQQQQQQQGPPPSLLSQNLKPPFHSNQQQSSSSNQPSFYPPLPPNQFGRQPVPIGAMNSANNRPQNQQVPSLMSGLSKNFSNNGNNMNNTQPLFQQRQPLLPPQSNNNRPFYQHHPQYPNYSKSTGPNDDSVKPKHI